jgi:TonB-dependent starch-binding outer membrane protein SusC
MKLKICKGIATFIFSITFSFIGFSQMNTLKGTIKDADGNPLFNASVVLEGKGKGAITDDEGRYEIKNIPSSDSAIKVIFRYTGLASKSELIVFKNNQTITKDVILMKDILQLDEAVVIGYGTTRTKDLTGAATVINEKNFVQGSVSTPEQLIQGKVAGVKINNNGGAPGSGSTIRLRGGTSINASNDPLIVVDGVPLDNGGIAGAPNPLTLINPNDIASFVILKDASATAIYGSRGANGVIIITTKKGDAGGANKLKVILDMKNSISTVAKYADVMTGDEFRTLVNEKGTAQQIALLGEGNTDWQREIYRNAYINENNVSVTGGIKNLPYRLSFGNRTENGLLKRDRMDRYSIGLNLTPKFLDNHLELEVNQKYVRTNTFFANRGAIGSANSFDPTQNVFSDTTTYGGYYEWLQPNGNPVTLASKNPVGLLNQREDVGNVDRYIGNIKLSYKLPFFPQVRAVVNAGTDLSEGTGYTQELASSASGFYSGGSSTQYRSTKVNKLLEAYVNYNNAEKAKKHRYDLTAGYSYQDWESRSPSFAALNYDEDSIIFPANPNPFYTKNALLSFYGRGIYSFADKYIITGSLRRDGSSRFSPETRWGLFPSISFAYILTEEKFMKALKPLTYLKIRGGFGVTGQQDGIGDYNYIPNYQIGTNTALYQFGNSFYSLLRPDGYDANLKWEETNSYNLGIDFGILKDRINGSIDFYTKTTVDLLATVPVLAGTNFTNNILTNVGSMNNRGVEMSTNIGLVAKKDLKIDLGLNATYNKNEVLKLAQIQDTASPGILIGGIAGGIGNTVQVHQVNYPTFTYFVYEQKYDANGKPIEVGQLDENGVAYTSLDAFEDRNRDGVINIDDRYYANQVAPDWFLGLNMNFTYKKWYAGFSTRAELGGYIYNNIRSNGSAFASVNGTQGFLNNLSTLYYEDEFQKTSTNLFLSDHFLEKANFLRMDYINVGYNFGKLKAVNQKIGLNVNFVVQNVFVISKYSGLDPEVGGGIDNNIYPRPRIYSLNLTFEF